MRETTTLEASTMCRCIDAGAHGPEQVVDVFAALREECVALSSLLAPDDAWPSMVAAWSSIVAGATAPNAWPHQSYLLLALQRGCLDRVTRPVHHFLMRDQQVRPDLTSQYRKDLPERWLLKSNEIERNRRFRGFFGKIVELQVAQWLADLRWTVAKLEALGHNCDIFARSPDGVPYSVEVKYIGQSDEDFQLALRSFSEGPVGDWFGIYSAINYLLFKAYDAAVGLRRQTGHKMAILVVDPQMWHLVEVPLANRWLDWNNPAFLRTEEQPWATFLESQRQGRYPGIHDEVSSVVRTLDRVWVATFGNKYEYNLAHDFDITGG